METMGEKFNKSLEAFAYLVKHFYDNTDSDMYGDLKELMNKYVILAKEAEKIQHEVVTMILSSKSYDDIIKKEGKET